MLITIPLEHTTNGTEKAWPLVECPRGTPIKATQRDLRRFNALRAGLGQLVAAEDQDAQRPDSHASDRSHRLSTGHSARLVREDGDESMDQIVEPQSWSALAYNGFMWWASAGEQIRSEEQEESARDAALLADLGGSGPAMRMPHSPSRTDLALTDSIASLTRHDASDDGDATMELAIIAYFHRLTTQIVSVLTDVVEGTDEAYPSDDPERYTDEDDDDDETDVLLPGADSNRDVDGSADTAQEQEEEETLETIKVDSHAMESMGLDVWSASDAGFVRDLAQRYFMRSATIEAKGVEVCGVRVC